MKKAITEVRGQDDAELRDKLGDLRKEQFGLRFRGSADEVAKTTRHREVRRTIARILTVLGERAAAGGAVGAGEAARAAASPKANPKSSGGGAAAARPAKAKASSRKQSEGNKS
ncbi:MAG TPA: 50S ribosomal protein L29 [Planctomycetota bacterium]|nr:50S ribosomal protein L29 [Planctomycetota bacterium]